MNKNNKKLLEDFKKQFGTQFRVKNVNNDEAEE